MNDTKIAAREQAEGRLANRAAGLTLIALCSFLLAGIVVPISFEKSDSRAARIAAATPIPVGLVAAVAARSVRAQLAALREEERTSHD